MPLVTVGEAIQRVQSIYSRGVQSDDTRLSPAHSYSVILSARAILLKQQSDRNLTISQWSYQALPCIELTPVSPAECYCADTSMKILRSAYKIPKVIADSRGDIFKYVSTVDGLVRFDNSNFEKEKYAKGNKYTANKPSFFIKNGYKYISNYQILRVITSEALFYDPLEVRMFPSACEDECEDCTKCFDPMEAELPIDGNMLLAICDIAKKELVEFMKQITDDRSNNTKDDSGTQGKMIHT